MTPRAPGRAPGWAGALVLALTLSALLAPGAAAQAAATVAPTDPVYADLERLEAFGLVPRGVSAQRPLSRGRLAWLATEARGWWQSRADAYGPEVRRDLDALLARVERRLNVGGSASASGLVEAEAGGGRSPGVWFPARDDDGRRVDAVSNPLWAYQGGRGYGDRATAALAARVDVGAGSSAALSLGGRTAWWDTAGPVGGRGRNALEAASGRLVLGSVAVEVGRSAAVWGRADVVSLLLSENGVPLDLVRIATDRPLSLRFLGDVDFTAFVADLGPRQYFPHTKEVGLRLEFRPTPAVTVGFSSLNKQGGDGAPSATWGRRLKDLSILGPAIFGDDGDPFSDKLVGADLRVAPASAQGLELTAAAVLTDFEKLRVKDVLDVAGGYRAGIRLPRLGASQRHALAVEGARTGVFVYPHFQFRSGLATESQLQGSILGPDARGVTLRYGYHHPRAGTRITVEGTAERRSADVYENRYEPHRDVYKVEDLPDETRLRLQVALTRWTRVGTLLLLGGVERVGNPTYPEAGPSRTNAAVLIRFSRSF